MKIDNTSPAANDPDASSAALVLEKLADAHVAGMLVEFSPHEAELSGAFDETAIAMADAWESVFDASPDAAGEER